MKPPERFPPDDPREWLNRARSNLARAKVFVPGNCLEDLCFDAQQAAEKAIKAVMIRRDIDFPLGGGMPVTPKKRKPGSPNAPRAFSVLFDPLITPPLNV